MDNEYPEESFKQDNSESDGYSFDDSDEVMQGERSEDFNSIDRIFNTEAFLYAIKKTLLGWEYSADGEWKPPEDGCHAVAQTKTINQIINNCRSFISTKNMLANMDDDDINFNMLELNKMIIRMLYDDPMVDKDEDSNETEYITNLVDHSTYMFMGIIRGGQGSESARQILSGNYLRLNSESKNKENPMFRIGTKEYDLLSIGSRRGR